METALSIISLVISALGFVLSLVNYVYYAKRERKQATLEAYNKLQNEALDILNSYTKKMVAQIAEDPRAPEYKKISSLLARCEHFSIGVNEAIYDKNVLIKLSGGYFAALYDKLEPLIIKKRSFSVNGNTDSQFYSAFEKLAKEVQ